jgi:hypothetical protein
MSEGDSEQVGAQMPEAVPERPEEITQNSLQSYPALQMFLGVVGRGVNQFSYKEAKEMVGGRLMNGSMLAGEIDSYAQQLLMAPPTTRLGLDLMSKVLRAISDIRNSIQEEVDSASAFKRRFRTELYEQKKLRTFTKGRTDLKLN